MLLAKLQVSHAGKEGMKVKTSQVLNKIKTRLVDIIWTDGYISETSCKKTLQDHHKIVQDVSDKFAVKRTTNVEQIQKVSEEKRLKRETAMNEEIKELIESYKSKEHSKYENTQPLWDNWTNMKQEVILFVIYNFKTILRQNKLLPTCIQNIKTISYHKSSTFSFQIEKHNTSMELTRQIQDLYNSTEDEFASNLQDEEINIILELVKMSRMDVNEFDKIIKNAVTGKKRLTK